MVAVIRLEQLSKRLCRLIYVVGVKPCVKKPTPITLQDFVHVTVVTPCNRTVFPCSYPDKHVVHRSVNVKLPSTVGNVAAK